MHSTNPISSTHLSASERLAELAEILAAGLVRLRARQSSTLSADCGESLLDFTGHQSGPEDPNSLEVEE
jgi:hypothetical protein